MSKETRVCPLCGKQYNEYPALSRKDNKTEICPECGTREAIEESEKHMCIFEKRHCRYANKQGNVFDCEAPSDDDMTCR